ncbi:MAG: peptidoglycan DD-metalloendopeptidase family protein [Gammaproteobacteria bacterium]|nr:peptidoglycan DD-metalloendopeptidase family protein [Gammaproteobacteria bacterium]MDP2347762.1 peptidoglycan DD-metalloendopeptidase family protein [Gammaproteobacteria bacterium]
MMPLRLLLVLLLPVLLASGHCNAAEEDIPEEQLSRINAAITEIEEWLNSAANNRSDLERALREATQAIDTATAAITQNEAAITTVEQELDVLTERSSELELARDAQEDMVKRALRASYMSGQESYLKLLLNQEDPALSSRMLRYYSDFNDARLAQIHAFRATLVELAETTAGIEAANQELLNHQAELERQLASLNENRATRSTLLAELDSDIALRSGELQQLTEDRERLEDLVEQIADAIANIPPPEQLTPFSQARGNLPWPVDGRRMNVFGAAYSDGNLHRQGIVLAADAGSPVRSIHPGRVVFSDWLRGSGLLVIVDHGEGYLSLYANNQTLIKRTGDWVNRNEALATAGTNGGLNSPGIYFEIRHNGQAQDPADWCL